MFDGDLFIINMSCGTEVVILMRQSEIQRIRVCTTVFSSIVSQMLQGDNELVTNAVTSCGRRE